MPRLMLTDARWEKLFHLMKSTGRVYDKPEHRQTFEGILYRLRTGIPWRDLPKEFGHWSTVFRRFLSGMMDSYAAQEYEKYFGKGSADRFYFK